VSAQASLNPLRSGEQVLALRQGMGHARRRLNDPEKLAEPVLAPGLEALRQHDSD
jgi:hypothetical protein